MAGEFVKKHQCKKASRVFNLILIQIKDGNWRTWKKAKLISFGKKESLMLKTTSILKIQECQRF